MHSRNGTGDRDGVIPEYVIESFIVIAKKLSENPDYSNILKEYAKELCKVCKELLLSVENLKRWFNRFLYFIFDSHSSTIRPDFYRLKGEYMTERQSHISELKIGSIKILDLRNRLKQDLQKRPELSPLVETLDKMYSVSTANGGQPPKDLISHMTLKVFSALNSYIDNVEKPIDLLRYDLAEGKRLAFKTETKSLSEEIERLEENFTILVERFAGYSYVTICLSRTSDVNS